MFKKISFTLLYCGSSTQITNRPECRFNANIQNIQSWIATKEAFRVPQGREQDKICQGSFKVHVDVFTDYGQKTSNDFMITVGPTWHDLDAGRLKCRCIQHKRFRRLRRLFSQLKRSQ
jgi:hypothetical protein